MTLTNTEKGFPPDVEFIGMPSVVKKEKGELSRRTESVHS